MSFLHKLIDVISAPVIVVISALGYICVKLVIHKSSSGKQLIMKQVFQVKKDTFFLKMGGNCQKKTIHDNINYINIHIYKYKFRIHVINQFSLSHSYITNIVCDHYKLYYPSCKYKHWLLCHK